VKAGVVFGALKGVYSLNLISGVLGSMRFRNTYCLALESPEITPDAMSYMFRLDTGRAAFA
jgi:hypothetical protein